MSRWLRAVGIVEGEDTPLVKTPKTSRTPSNEAEPEVLGVLQVLTKGVSRPSSAQGEGIGGFEGFDETPFDERAATLQLDAGLPRPEAEERAAQEGGFADARAYREHLLSCWLRFLRIAKKRGPTRASEVYVENAIGFIEEGWAEKCLRLGWGVHELLWADERAPWARLDNLGAAYLARGAEMATAESITCGVSSGSPLIIRRVRGDGQTAPPWDAVEATP